MSNNTGPTAAQRKKVLVAQGAMYRLGLVESKNALQANLQPDVLAKSALNSFVTTASTALGHGFNLRNLSGANLQAILPVAISVVSLLAKRKALIKPLLIGAIALAAAIGIARLVSKKKEQQQSAAVVPDHDASQFY